MFGEETKECASIFTDTLQSLHNSVETRSPTVAREDVLQSVTVPVAVLTLKIIQGR